MTQNTAKLVFWGVRGSTPTLERDTWRYGGNTACLEFIAPGGTRFIFDCGTGLRMLGNRLRARIITGLNRSEAVEAHVLVTHYHWDHIQGIPFFHPFFEAQNRFHFYSFESKSLGRHSLRQVFEAQLAKPYFPVDVEHDDRRCARSAKSRAAKSGKSRARKSPPAWLNHPQGCLGYRLDTPRGPSSTPRTTSPACPNSTRIFASSPRARTC